MGGDTAETKMMAQGADQKEEAKGRESVKCWDLGKCHKCFRNNRIRWTWVELGIYFFVGEK